MDKNIRYRLLAMLVIYLILKYLGGSFGRLALYPVTLMVTFLHEFGHALGAILTGGGVKGVLINTDGSGQTTSLGGNQGIILMGGYFGSAIFGNILLYIGVRKRAMTQATLMVLAILMLLTGIVWFQGLASTALLVGFAVGLYLIAKKTNYDQDVLMFLGLATVLYIIQDINVGPTSDLAKYEEEVGIFPFRAWQLIWLIGVVLLSYWNLRKIFRTGNGAIL